jgi:hypothetical protein
MIHQDESVMTEKELQDLRDSQDIMARNNQMEQILKDSGEYPVMSFKKLREINDSMGEVIAALKFIMLFLGIIGLVLIYIAFKI